MRTPQCDASGGLGRMFPISDKASFSVNDFGEVRYFSGTLAGASVSFRLGLTSARPVGISEMCSRI